MSWKLIPSTPKSPSFFAIFRIIFGTYLAIHFVNLIPYASELYSREGVLADASLNFTAGRFPNLLTAVDSPIGASLFVSSLAILSVMLIFGVRRRTVSLLLWYGWACLFHRNNLISNPGLPFIGWLLLASAAVPGEDEEGHIRIPQPLFAGAWLIMALSYTISGYHKLSATSWTDGSAIIHLMSNPLARDTAFRTFMLSLPGALLRLMTWGVLALEVLFLPLSLFHRGRLVAWVAMVGAHLGILTCVNFSDLTFGVLMVHVFTFDPSWLPGIRSKGEEPSILFFDGYCGLCDGFVSFVLREDLSGVVRLGALQGPEAARRLPEALTRDVGTVAYLEGARVWTRSDAVLRVLYRIGGLWRLSIILWCVPRRLRDAAYSLVASNRYRWFGRKASCRMPTPSERARFV